jgi:hypothetical protein
MQLCQAGPWNRLRGEDSLILTYAATKGGITEVVPREANKNKKGVSICWGRPGKAAVAPLKRDGQKLEREPQSKTNGSAGLISVRLAVGAANRGRATRGVRW